MTMRVLACLSCAALISGVASAQPREPRPSFDMADVHVSPHTNNAYLRGPIIRGGRYEVRTATMVDLIAIANGMDNDKVLAGPSWLEWDRFDVIARMPAAVTKEAQKAMLQSLLEDRFKLKTHTDTQPMPAYELTAGKHPQLKPADASDGAGCKWSNQPSMDGGPFQLPPTLNYTCSNMTMASFAEGMRDMVFAGQYLNNNPVVDRTGLKGAWNFTLKYSLRGPRGATDADTITFFDAVEKQLGLKLEPANVPLPVMVVDSVNRMPAENLPGVKETLEGVAPPTEFEVADVKPTDPASGGMGFRIQRGGRVNISGMTLNSLIQQAWNVNNDMLVGAPKWLDTDRFDIIAKAPAAASGTGEDIDYEDVLVMLRGLLKDRFKLEAHMEERPISAYTLLAVKPRMKKADPASRTTYKEGPGSNGNDPRVRNPALSRLVTCQNMTMGQFAEKLQNMAGGYIHAPVLDATGLDGAYDFTLSFSRAGQVRNGAAGRGGRGGDAGPPPSGAASDPIAAASDPSGAISLPEAIDRQLGLKLELQKRPVMVLVIDRVEQKPTDN